MPCSNSKHQNMKQAIYTISYNKMDIQLNPLQDNQLKVWESLEAWHSTQISHQQAHKHKQYLHTIQKRDFKKETKDHTSNEHPDKQKSTPALTPDCQVVNNTLIKQLQLRQTIKQ